MKIYPKKDLHDRFFDSLGKENILSYSNKSIRPLDIETSIEHFSNIRLYLFPLTNPPGGRVKEEREDL